MLFERRMHLYSMKSPLRDGFRAANTSLFDEKSAEGCFSSGEYIPIRKNSSPRIIFQRRMHPYSEEFVARDYFPETDTSLFDEKFAAGCFSKGKCIPQGHESTLGMH